VDALEARMPLALHAGWVLWQSVLPVQGVELVQPVCPGWSERGSIVGPLDVPSLLEEPLGNGLLRLDRLVCLRCLSLKG
jgi:hypothetical protein